MIVTFHQGELKRYAVHVKCVSHPRLKINPENVALVFATNPEAAKLKAVAKMKDKYLQHQNKETRWITTDEPIEA